MFLIQIGKKKKNKKFKEWKNILILQFSFSTMFSSKLHTQLRQSYLTKKFVEGIKLTFKNNVYFKVQ